MNNRIFQKAINLVFTLALAFGLLLPGSTTLASPRPAGAPDDPGYTAPGIDIFGNAGTQYQWNLSNRPLPGDPPSDIWGINAPRAWDITTGLENTVVAVIDSGLAPNDDLDFGTGRILDGYDFITNSVNANDGGGRDADASDPGDWCDLPLPDGVVSSWHGSHVAGIIGATSNNGAGIAGINWAARILPVRVSGKCGVVNAADLMDGMNWAAGLPVTGVTTNPNPADVINVSVGVSGEACTTHQTAINAIIASGAVIVAAAGDNDSTAIDFPANCTGVITVAATDKLGSRASYSNKGQLVKISAPGSDVLSTTNSNDTTPNIVDPTRYTTKTGTGVAAAHVSGVVSLMLAGNPSMTPSQIEETLIQTAQAFPSSVGIPCTTSDCGSGIVDARAALKPDLIITNIGLAPLTNSNDECPASVPLYSPGADELFCVNITVLNKGGSNSGQLVYRNVFIDRDPSTLPMDANGCIVDNNNNNDYGDYFRQDLNASLPAGAEVTQGVKIKNSTTIGLPAGPHAIFAYTDAQCNVGEVFENNNEFAPMAVGGTIINIGIGGENKGAYALAKGNSIRQSYDSENNGPVRVTSIGTQFIDSMRVLYGGVSYSELMGFPANQLTKDFWFPYYNNVAMNSQLRVGNVGGSPTTITVTYGNGTPLDSYILSAGAATRKNYPGINSGPLHVTSSDSNILATIRVVYVDQSYSELMGFPNNQLAKNYWFPYYNNVAMNSQLRVSNVGGASTTITVTYGNNIPLDSYTLAAGAATRINYPGINSGPLHVTSSASNILTTIRVVYGDQSYSELSGFPANQLTKEYIYPVYNNVTADSQLRVSNVGGVSTTITVYGINNTVIDSYPLAAGAAMRKNYVGINDGPLRVLSSASNILSTQRLLYTTPSFVSFYELGGFPTNQLTTDYYFPWYNNTAMSSQLRIAIP